LVRNASEPGNAGEAEEPVWQQFGCVKSEGSVAAGFPLRPRDLEDPLGSAPHDDVPLPHRHPSAPCKFVAPARQVGGNKEHVVLRGKGI
jgi:hypothetical protein